MTDSSRTQATIGERVACLSKVSFAKRDYAVLAANRIAEKTGIAPHVLPCGVCKGFHLSKKGASS